MIVKQLFRQLHIDQATAVVIASRVWQFLSGPITIAMLFAYTSLSERTLFYGFAVVLNLQSFFDAGLSNVIITIAGNQYGKLGSASDDVRADVKQQLAQLLAVVRRWYGGLAIVFLVISFGWGSYLFSNMNAGEPWWLPWLIIVPLSSSSLWFTPQLSYLEGTGHRQAIYVYRFLQSVIGTLVVWAVLWTNGAVWAAVASTAVQTLVMAHLVWNHFRYELWGHPPVDMHAAQRWWKKDVLAVQWRVAAQSVVVYLASQLLLPIVILFRGSNEGGVLGPTLAALIALQQVAMAWLQTRYPLIASAVPGREHAMIWLSWRRVTLVSLAVLAACGLSFAGLLYGLSFSNNSIAITIVNGFCSPSIVVIIVLAYAANHIAVSQAYFAMACWRKPLFNATMIGLGFTAAIVWIGGWIGGTLGLAIAYAIGMACVFLPLHTWAFMREWESR